MNESPLPRRDPKTLALGVLLVVAGSVMLLGQLDVLAIRWNSVGWLGAAVFGLFLTVDGFIRKKGGEVFWGTLLAVFSGYWALARWDVIHHHGFYTTPVLFLALGLSFVCLFFLRRGEPGFLVPAFLFLGTATVMMLWWWEYVEWYDVRYALRTYWPVIFVIWGAVLLLRRGRPSAVSHQ